MVDDLRMTGALLSQACRGRDNNLNLIRFLAASAVLVSHSIVLVTGDPDREPLRRLFEMTPGTIAVDVFFVVSGFLVTNSLLKRQSLWEFARARLLRIWPALLVMCALLVFVLGPLCTSLSLSAYLGAAGTWTWLARCATLIAGVEYELPGVFTHNPYPEAVNGSLWTLPLEVRMYALLALLWLGTGLLFRDRLQRFRTGAVVAALAGTALLLGRHAFGMGVSHSLRLAALFFTGSAYCVLAGRIALRPWAGPLALLGIVGAGLSGSNALFLPVYVLLLPYAVLWLAYVPRGFVRGFNRFGDYSYGMYIYAFPVQQCAVFLLPSIGIGAMVLVSMAVTLLLAIASWHLIEKTALARKERGAAQLSAAEPTVELAVLPRQNVDR